MKVTGIIPSRYQSVRFPGKPLADICGQPMVWWVYQQAKKASMLDEVYVATDDERIKKVCKEKNINVLMTDSSIPSPTDRMYAVSKMIQSDYYICINGDEPLISPESINAVAKKALEKKEYDVVHAVTSIGSPAEAVDYTNLKVVAKPSGEAVYISRSPVPYPKGSLDFKYKKLVCIYSFSENSLDFFCNTPKGMLETVEECDILRFIENGKRVLFVDVDENSLSVDTPKDLIAVRKIIEERAGKSNEDGK